MEALVWLLDHLAELFLCEPQGGDRAAGTAGETWGGVGRRVGLRSGSTVADGTGKNLPYLRVSKTHLFAPD